ncbi:hypothetical protein [Streptomyces sp. NPDC051572]|uniref:hypothetical protein n=1 Tax=Streptomyces sp. NPDC051572 TaxID=3155802 RepID=UPI00344DD703
MEESSTGRGEGTGEPGADEVERTAALLQEAFGLLGVDPRALLRASAGPTPTAGFVQLAAGRRGRERLRLMFAEDPVLVLWLDERVEGREVLAAVELEHGPEEPDAEVADAAVRAAAGPRQADFRRRWAEERRRDFEEYRVYAASPARLAASDRTRAAMMDAFRRRHRP